MALDLRRPERTFTIRQLCVEFKCTPRALRFYEDKGLLTPAREGLNRVYSYRDRARLQLILRGKRVGLSLAEIREIFELYDVDRSAEKQTIHSLKKFKERLADLERQREDINGAIDELHAAIVGFEARVSNVAPDSLPRTGDLEQMQRTRLDVAVSSYK